MAAWSSATAAVSRSINPNSWWSDTGKGLLRELGVDVRRFETAFERNLYSSLGLSRGMFFAREAFGRDHLATGDALIMPRNEVSRRLANAKPLTEFVAGFPISEASKTQLHRPLFRDARSARRHAASTRS